jgi:hypothetical protein
MHVPQRHHELQNLDICQHWRCPSGLVSKHTKEMKINDLPRPQRRRVFLGTALHLYGNLNDTKLLESRPSHPK